MSERGCGGCSRRDALVTLGIATLAPFMPGCSAKSSLGTASAARCTGGFCIDLRVAANAPLRSVGGGLLLETGGDRIAVVRQSATQIAAVSALCTHEGCLNELDASTSTFDCPCHGSSFSLSGNVLRGPASIALRVYTASIAGDVVTVIA